MSCHKVPLTAMDLKGLCVSSDTLPDEPVPLVDLKKGNNMYTCRQPLSMHAASYTYLVEGSAQ